MNEIEKPWKLLMIKFEIPQSKRIQFEKIIRTQTPESASKLATASLTRNEMIIIIEKSSPSSIIMACEKYIPDLYGLVSTVEDNNTLRLNEQLSFNWSSIASKSFYSGFSLRFELIMNLVTYGFAHYNRAAEINDSSNEANFDENAKLIINHLKIAAGIYNFITSFEMPRWQHPPEDRPVECHNNFILAMYELCLSTALAVTVRKALKQGTSPGVISKLSCEAWHRAEMSKSFLKDLGSQFYKKLPKSLRTYYSTLIKLQHSTTMMFMALNSKSQQNFGDALGYFSIALPLLKVKKPSETRIANILNGLITEIQNESNTFSKENEVIYFQKKSDPNSLEKPSPMAKSIINMITFSPPCPSFIDIH
ncbi:hypothetical protein DICPUDRAFT_81911 [Dictyostelium purpureum]|uniref:BRO1 domain-containing protein n=1 Tax=Dictyostelium purpureum TaxID=5786 RepID=F0ZUY7_DICPU|nr:uncharacterized protein DICPUDRAFT_81911 [Dictyostelium purpureum]EGC32230.1 hypothetical protein DICPUDRAFT_81911 [Dictyostelium purpureum]|eukprot:XP_003291228.1 hypothetical protein DICPUDRAFT_81911 [Dictyostelium purpureum]